MAKKRSTEKNNRRKKLAKAYAGRRERLLAVANDESPSIRCINTTQCQTDG